MTAVHTANKALITSVLNMLHMLRNFPYFNMGYFSESDYGLLGKLYSSSHRRKGQEHDTISCLILFCLCPSFLSSQKSAPVVTKRFNGIL